MLRAINKPDSPLRRAAAAMPLLAWVALGTFVLALAAAAASSTGRYVADARFEIYWGTGRYLRSQLSLWDGVRNLGRPNPYFSPVVGVFVGALRLIGLSPAWAERVLHAAMISLGATGAAAVMAQRRPKDRTAVVLTALVFGFNPIVAEFLVPSGIFFHYALAPWLVWCVQGAVAAPGRTAPWKWPARTALVIFAMGAINSASLLYAFGPAVVVAAGLVLVEARGRPDRHARLRSLWGYAWRAAVLGLASAAAALVVLAVNGPVVQANLSVTELPQTVSAHSSWAESLRGLGYWLTYFGGGGTTRPHPSPFVINQFAAALSLLLPLVALITLVRTKWRPARTFGWLLVLAMVAMVGLYPVDGDYPVGKAMSWLFDNVATTRSLRNGYKAGAGWALAIAVLVGIGVSDAGSSWLRRRAGRPGAARRSDNARFNARHLLSAGAAAIVLVAAVPFWSANLYPEAETTAGVPQYWKTAAAYLNDLPNDGRVLILPGANRTRYRWGYIGDDLFDALLSQPYVSRSTLPQGTPQAADLLDALDRYVTGPTFEPGVIGPILARMGIKWVVLRNDLNWEVMGAPRPISFNGLRGDPDLKRIATFGAPGVFVAAPDRSPDAEPSEEEQQGLSPVEVFEVADSPGMARVDPRPPLLVAGSGPAWPGMATAGYLDADGPVRYLPTMSSATTERLLDQGSSLVITDSNRRRVQRGTAEQNFLSPVLPEGEDGDDRPARPLFDGPGRQTVADYGDASSITATAYGAPNQTFPPSNRPSNATDENPRTAWALSGLRDPRGESLTINLRRPTVVDRASISQLRNPADTPSIARMTVTDDQGRSVAYNLGTGTTSINLPPREVRSLNFRIDAVNTQSAVGVGLTEVALFDSNSMRLDLAERLVMPTVPDLDGAGDAARYLMERSMMGAPLVEEPSLRRRFETVGAARNYRARVWAGAGVDTPDVVLDNLDNHEVGAYGSSRFQDRLRASGSGAVDAVGDDLGQSWEASPVSGETLTLRLPETSVTSLSMITPGADDLRSSKIDTLTVSGFLNDDAVYTNVEVTPEKRCAPELSERADRCLARTEIELPPASVDRVVIRVGAVSPVADASGPLPISITELGVNGRIGFDKTAQRRSPEDCINVLTVDDTKVGVRLTATKAQLLAGTTELEVCDKVGLRPGNHELQTTLGGDGLINRVSLVPQDLKEPTPPADSPDGGKDPLGTATLTNLNRTSLSADLKVTGPTQVIIGEAAGAGWSASFDGESAKRSVALDTMAGWPIDQPADMMVAVYTPQRTYTIALGISLLSVTLATILAFRGDRRRTRRQSQVQA